MPPESDPPTDSKHHPHGQDSLAASLHRVQHDVETLAEEMVHLQRQAALGAVAGLLAHEVNNILTPVLAHVRIARKPGADTEQIERALAVTDDSIGRTAEIARAILALGRGGVVDEVPSADVLEVARSALAALGRDLGRDGITCELRIAAGVRVQISPTSFQQVMVNLFQNARTAMLTHSGAIQGARLTVSARTFESSPWNSGGVEIVVQDSGPGVRPEDRERIFDPFVRGVNPTCPRGSGLGLSVCRELVSAAGGTIRLEPESGPHDPSDTDRTRPDAPAGARFVIRLPAVKMAERGEPRADANDPGASATWAA